MREVLAGGVRFNVVTMGVSGPVLALVHGLVLDNHSSFYLTLAPALARRARLVLYDLRGHGRSEQPPTGYTLDDMASDLFGVLDALGHREPAILLGHSFGVQVALRAASRRPGRVRGLVLVESHSGEAELGARMAETLALEGETRREKVKELFGHWLAKHQARGHVDPAVAAAQGALDADGQASLRQLARLERRRRSPMVATAEALRDRTTLARDLAATAPLEDRELARIACPALAVYGADSEILADGRRLAGLLPDCRLVEVEGCGHGLLYQATERLREEILGWLEQVAP